MRTRDSRVASLAGFTSSSGGEWLSNGRNTTFWAPFASRTKRLSTNPNRARIGCLLVRLVVHLARSDEDHRVHHTVRVLRLTLDAHPRLARRELGGLHLEQRRRVAEQRPEHHLLGTVRLAHEAALDEPEPILPEAHLRVRPER